MSEETPNATEATPAVDEPATETPAAEEAPAAEAEPAAEAGRAEEAEAEATAAPVQPEPKRKRKRLPRAQRRQRLVADSGRVSTMRTMSPTCASLFSSCAWNFVERRMTFW